MTSENLISKLNLVLSPLSLDSFDHPTKLQRTHKSNQTVTSLPEKYTFRRKKYLRIKTFVKRFSFCIVWAFIIDIPLTAKWLNMITLHYDCHDWTVTQ